MELATAGTPDARRARRGLAIYFAILVPCTALIEWSLVRTGDAIESHMGLVAMLMATPTFASLVARLFLREGIRDVSFRFGGRTGGRALVLAWLFPLAVGFAAYGLAWITGLSAFTPPPLTRLGLSEASPALRFAATLVLNATIGTLTSSVFAAGEEIGWRGYMLTRLLDAGVRRPVLVSGIVWGLWHVPLILTGQYASSSLPALSAMLFLADVTAFAYLAARLRLESGSVWPAVLLHGSWNALIQGVFDASTTGNLLWTGESGILVVAFDILLIALVCRGTWHVKRSPAETPTAVDPRSL